MIFEKTHNMTGLFYRILKSTLKNLTSQVDGYGQLLVVFPTMAKVLWWDIIPQWLEMLRQVLKFVTTQSHIYTWGCDGVLLHSG